MTDWRPVPQPVVARRAGPITLERHGRGRLRARGLLGDRQGETETARHRAQGYRLPGARQRHEYVPSPQHPTPISTQQAADERVEVLAD